MRIIGGHDYYDKMLAVFGRDEDITLVRNEPRQIIERNFRINVATLLGYETQSIYPVVVIVAGKRFNCVRVKHRAEKDAVMIDHHFFDYDRLKEFIDTNIPEKSKSIMFSGPRFFSETVSSDMRQWLIDNRIVTAVYDHERNYSFKTQDRYWNVNDDSLKSVELVKVLDPFTCYQEIYSWVSSVLPRNANPMVEITDDKIKAAKHGFDKFSFRKGKSK